MTHTLAINMFPGPLTKEQPSMNAWPVGSRAMTAQPNEIEQIYRNYGGMVLRRCTQLLKAEAEAMDATQDVFIRVLRSIHQFRRQSSPATWLYRISTNLCLNRIRDKHNRVRLNQTAIPPLETTKPVEVWSRDLVLRVLAKFDQTTQEVVVYSVVEGMTYDEIAEVLGCSVSRVRKCMSKFKAQAPKKAQRLLKESA